MVFLCRIGLTASISLLLSLRALVSQHLNQDWYFYSCFVSQNLLQLLRWWQNKDKTVRLPPPKPSSPREPFGILLIFHRSDFRRVQRCPALAPKPGLGGEKAGVCCCLCAPLCCSFAVWAPGRPACPKIPITALQDSCDPPVKDEPQVGSRRRACHVLGGGGCAASPLPPWGPAVRDCWADTAPVSACCRSPAPLALTLWKFEPFVVLKWRAADLLAPLPARAEH